MKSTLAYLLFFGVIAVGLVSINRQGWERDERALERIDQKKRAGAYQQRAKSGPYVVSRSDLSSDEELNT